MCLQCLQLYNLWCTQCLRFLDYACSYSRFVNHNEILRLANTSSGKRNVLLGYVCSFVLFKSGTSVLSLPLYTGWSASCNSLHCVSLCPFWICCFTKATWVIQVATVKIQTQVWVKQWIIVLLCTAVLSFISVTRQVIWERLGDICGIKSWLWDLLSALGLQ